MSKIIVTPNGMMNADESILSNIFKGKWWRNRAWKQNQQQKNARKSKYFLLYDIIEIDSNSIGKWHFMSTYNFTLQHDSYSCWSISYEKWHYFSTCLYFARISIDNNFVNSFIIINYNYCRCHSIWQCSHVFFLPFPFFEARIWK